MVVLAGHGNGVEGDFLADVDPDLSSGQTPSSLSLVGLKWVFKEVADKLRKQRKKIDILGMDSCLMSMTKVGYELRDYVNYLIGAEGSAFNTGWPYHRLLTAFRKRFEDEDAWKDPRKLAPMILHMYIRYYHDYESTGMSTDQALSDLPLYRRLRSAVSKLSDQLVKGIKNKRIKDAILLAHWRAQSYKDNQYTDLWDFCHCLAKLLGKREGPLKSACGAVKVAIEGRRNGKEVEPGFVMKCCYSGGAFQHSHGVSVYFPWANSDFLRKATDFPKANRKFVPRSIYDNLDFTGNTLRRRRSTGATRTNIRVRDLSKSRLRIHYS